MEPIREAIRRMSSPRRLDPRKQSDYLPELTEDIDMSVDPASLDPFLLALSVVEFQPLVFLREFCLHAMQHLSLLLLLTHRKRVLAYNREFIGWTFGCFLQWTMFGFMMTCVAIFFWDRPEQLGWDELAITGLLFVFRHAVIAFKYAFTSPIELQRMEEELESTEAKKQRQVLTGWSRPNKELVQREILLASVRQWLDLTQGYFYVKKERGSEPSRTDGAAPVRPEDIAVVNDLHVRYAAYLEQHQQAPCATPTPMANCGKPRDLREVPDRVAVWNVINELIEECHRSVKSMETRLIPAVIFCAIPFAVRWWYGQYVVAGTRWTAYAYAVASVSVNFLMVMSNVGFVHVCLIDFQRREYLFTRLKAILLDGFVRDGLTSSTRTSDGNQESTSVVSDRKEPTAVSNGEPPAATADGEPSASGGSSPDDQCNLIQLDMDSSHNLLMWWYTRQILQDYGKVYLMRLQCYCGTFIVLALILGIILLLFVFDKLKTVTAAGLYCAVWIVIVIFVALFRALYDGLNANYVRKQHSHVLFRKSIILSTRAERMRAKNRERSAEVKDAANLCWVLAQACQDDEEAGALRVLGLPCSPELVTSFGSIAVAALSAGMQTIRSGSFGVVPPPGLGGTS
ncbi:hypothetical protein H9P43_001361 [Blastocladiella emersonii ATCC 22665]|nr:hypothetical protein H9P43_001361 [Blastocladiella emersonii ATCC 22665]